MMRPLKAFCVVGMLATLVSGQAASITGLGFLPGRPAASLGMAISGDGSTVVGIGWIEPNTSFQEHAFRWTAATGLQDIHGTVSGDFDESEARAVSADGSIVVGKKKFIAFRWTAPGGVVPLGDLPGGPSISTARAVSSDGSVVFGSGYVDSGFRAFKWTDAGGMIEISEFEHIYSCSGDGKVAIGNGSSKGAMRWEDGVGVSPLGDFSPCATFGGSYGTAISRDGKILVGSSYPKTGSCDFFDENSDGFRWTSDGGLQELGRFKGGFGMSPAAVSGAGALIGGSTQFFDEGQVGLLWDASGHAWKVWDVLAEQGADLSHWKRINVVTGISDNGLVLAGTGVNLDGKEEAFRAVLDHSDLFGFFSVERIGSSVAISWPKNYSTARPEFSSGASGSWTAMAEPIELKGDFYVVTKEISGETAFFRLVMTR